MKDLLVFCADLDTLAVMEALLGRTRVLGTRPVVSGGHRDPGRDSGVVTQGPETSRVYKGHYEHLLLMCDHHGSGWDGRSPARCEQELQRRLDACTWLGRSAAFVLEPEIEAWLWHDLSSLATHLGCAEADLKTWEAEFVRRTGCRAASVRTQMPKELFEFVCKKKLRRTITADDFRQIAARADLEAWTADETFRRLRAQLQQWFPA